MKAKLALAAVVVTGLAGCASTGMTDEKGMEMTSMPMVESEAVAALINPAADSMEAFAGNWSCFGYIDVDNYYYSYSAELQIFADGVIYGNGTIDAASVEDAADTLEFSTIASYSADYQTYDVLFDPEPAEKSVERLAHFAFFAGLPSMSAGEGAFTSAMDLPCTAVAE